jgi:hypothetical protein
MRFKEYLLEKVDNFVNEADLVLHQIISNVDDSHVDYSKERLDFNLGTMIKRSDYFRLYLTVLNSDSYSCKLAQNNKRDGFTIVITTDKYPARKEIDTLLSNKNIYSDVKEHIITYISKYKEDVDGVYTSYEEVKQINTPEKFDDIYNEAVAEIKRRIQEFEEISSDMEAKLETTANEVERESLVRGIEKLKDEYFGTTFKMFKRIIADLVEIDLTRFDKEYKQKWDSRLEDFYENITKL